MVNIKSVVDSTMGKIVKDGPKKPGANEDIKAFYDAVLQNEQFQNGILNTMQESAQKYAGIAMSAQKLGFDGGGQRRCRRVGCGAAGYAGSHGGLRCRWGGLR